MVILHFKKVSVCDDFYLIVSAECYSRTEHLTCFEKNVKKLFCCRVQCCIIGCANQAKHKAGIPFCSARGLDILYSNSILII